MTDTTSNANSGRARSGKLLVIVLSSLVAVALVLFLWLVLVAVPDRVSTRSMMEGNLKRVKMQMETLGLQADKVKSERLESVTDISALVGKVATNQQIMQNLTISKQTTRNLKGGSYEQVQCDVNFNNKMGYKFLDLVNLMKAIEDTNPKVQVSMVNFGLRREDIPGESLFQPLNMTVRVFNPRK
jgi:hypothetical protein